jgi:signal transduction histidine kinase/DNA-binding response OmpR family regulator
LRIKTTNSSGIWNPNQKLIEVVVLPPWYRTWYAYLLYLTGLTAGIYVYVRYQKKQASLVYEIELAELKVRQEQELNEKKISFFINISHELRGPLTLIANPIKEFLKNNCSNAELIDFSSVHRNSRRLLSMVDQLLLFRKVEDDVTDFSPDFIDLKTVAEEVFLCFINQARSKQINYTFHAPDKPVPVFADREKIEIVIFNILSNALKYTPVDGTVSLGISVAERHAEISISDTGPGIPLNCRTEIFEKFYRVPFITENTRKGFGIGLYLAKKLIDIHQGEIAVEEPAGGGTVFHVRIATAIQPTWPNPSGNNEQEKHSLVKDWLPDLIRPDSPVSAENIKVEVLEEITSSKFTILLIDDDDDLRDYIKTLIHPDYIICEASSAEDGFATVMKNEPDVIICDVVMRGMSGVEFCSKIKESRSSSHIPVILLTSSSSAEIKLKGIECGADDYITKPFESELLVARIKSILKGRETLKTYFHNEVTHQNNTIKVPEEYSRFLANCIAIIERHITDENFNVKIFAQEIGMSHSTLFKKIKSISGLSVSEFIRFIRLRKAAGLMLNTDLQIKEIAFLSGFQQVRYFREQFSKVFGTTPSGFINKHRQVFAARYKVNSGLLRSQK